jgi:hypothetical protein
MSDSEIVKGADSDNAQDGITSFDIEFSEDLSEFIADTQIVSAKVETKNGQFVKQKLCFEYDQVDQEILVERMNYAQEEE